MVSDSPTTRQRERLPANMSLLHRLGGMSHNISQRPKLSLSVHSQQPSGVFHTIYFCIFVFWYGLAPSFAIRPLSYVSYLRFPLWVTEISAASLHEDFNQR